MIASVAGKVAAVGPDVAIVEIGGVGLALSCTPATLASLRVGEPAALSTALVVRETELTLYGFVDADEREVFETLQTAAGVGPRLAQAVLATFRPDDIRRAVATEDLAALCKVPGIGKKGAARIVLDLKDRLGAPSGSGVSATVLAFKGARPQSWEDQLRTALGGLGYSGREVDDAIAAVAIQAAEGEQSVPVLLRSALTALRPA
ncbi:MAG TPA: Holliday junction branch migration protein RuvA [Frankiaceae bacterium]|jgi:Holliday junction DNA helicase RuvA|nr:Holliday junction branch migration protein RuvA [Frankiaceae bacterium]